MISTWPPLQQNFWNFSQLYFYDKILFLPWNGCSQRSSSSDIYCFHWKEDFFLATIYLPFSTANLYPDTPTNSFPSQFHHKEYWVASHSRMASGCSGLLMSSPRQVLLPMLKRRWLDTHFHSISCESWPQSSRTRPALSTFMHKLEFSLWIINIPLSAGGRKPNKLLVCRILQLVK